jgi:hypothetical protein
LGRIVSVMSNLNSVGTSNLNSAGATLLPLGGTGGSAGGFSFCSVVRGVMCGAASDGQTSPVGNPAGFLEISAAITEVEEITAAM